MPLPPMRIRFIDGVAVVGVGEHAPGGLLGPDGLIGCCREYPRVVIDLIGADTVSSEWLGQLVRAHQTLMQTGHQLRMCCPTDMLREVFGITRLAGMQVVFPTLAEALASFDEPRI